MIIINKINCPISQLGTRPSETLFLLSSYRCFNSRSLPLLSPLHPAHIEPWNEYCTIQEYYETCWIFEITNSCSILETTKTTLIHEQETQDQLYHY